MISRSLLIERKRLYIYDFDDTLVKTDSYIYITNTETGNTRKLTPGEYAVYVPKKTDEFDFSDFQQVHKPSEIKHVTDDLRRVSTKSGKHGVYILTARSAYKPIVQYLKDIGINSNKVRVVALGDSNPLKKSEWIEQMIDDNGYDDIYFIDDSEKNIQVVGKMLRNKDVRYKLHHLKH
jgi:hypothetical protein